MAVRDEQARAADIQAAGTSAKGEFRCAECGYGVVVHDVLPACPMCFGLGWERGEWRPFTRDRESVETEFPALVL